MPKVKNKHHSYWVGVGLVGVLLEAPNATILRYLTFDTDPFVLNMLRFLIIGALTIPFIIFAHRKFNKKNVKFVLLAGVNMTVAVLAYTWALKHGPASYVSIITLLTPILLVLFSIRLAGERVNLRSAAGVTLAAAGALVIVALPIAVHGSEFVFYPESTVFALINCVTFALAILYSKKANEKGIPMTALIGTYAWLTAIVCTLIVSATATAVTLPSTGSIALIVYSSLGVALLARALTIFSYERVGAATTSGLTYFGLLVSIIIPLVLLGEKLSVEIVIGGVLILLGIYVLEQHKFLHHKHHHALRGH